MSRRNKIVDQAHFDSWAEFLDFFANAKVAPEWQDDNSSEASRGSWTMSDSYEHAMQLATEGWQHGTAEMTESMDEVRPYVEAAARLPSLTLSPAGFMPDVPSYCAGQPANMWTRDPENADFGGQTPVVRMLVNLTASWSVDSKALFNRGSAIVGAVDYLEACGVQCEIVVACRTESYDTVVEYTVPIKQAGEQLDVDRVAFAIANPSMLRRFFFRLAETNPDLRKTGHAGGRGTPADLQPASDQVYLPAMLGSWANRFNDEREALRYVLERIAEKLDDRQRIQISDDWAELGLVIEGQA